MAKKNVLRSDGGCELEVEVGEHGILTITDIIKTGAAGVLNLSDFNKDDIEALRKEARKKIIMDEEADNSLWTSAYGMMSMMAAESFTVDFTMKGKVYVDVKKIILGNLVSFLYAGSEQFPGVESVFSESFRFKTTSLSKQGFAGIVYAVEKTYLLNVFNYKNTIDISGVGQISADAFVKGTDTSSLVFKDVSPGMSIVSSMPSFVKRTGKAKRLDPSNSDVFKRDAEGLYWYGNIIVSTDNGKIATDRKDAYILKEAAESAIYLDIPDVVLLRMSKDAKRIDDRSIRLHITQELGAQLREQAEHCESGQWSGQWGYITGFVSDCDDYADEGGVLYTKDFKKLVLCPPKIWAMTDTVHIHEGTEEICADAFKFARVDHICMPDSVKTIDSSAFAYCYAKDINLSSGLSSIENESESLAGQFSSCPRLKSVRIPGSVKYIAMRSFNNCLELESVEFEEGAAETIGREAFKNAKIKSISLPKSCKRVEKNAFPSTLREMTAYSGTRGVAGSIDSSYFVNTNIPTTFTLIKDDGTKQRLCVPAEVRKKGLVCTAIDIAFCRGNIPCSIAELVFNVMTDVSPRARKEAVYNKSQAALIAVMEYGTEDEHIRKFLKTSAPYFAERLISGSDTKTLSELLSLHVLSPASLERLLALASSSGEVESAALISEEIRRKSGRAKTALKI